MINILSIVSLFLALAVAEDAAPEIKYSDPRTIVWSDDKEGSLKFTSQTYLKGEEGYQTAWLKAKIEITDKNAFSS